MKTITNTRGQSLIETLLILPVVFAVTAGLAFVCYRSLVFYYADLKVHEAALCATQHSANACEKKYSTEIKQILLWGKIYHFSIHKSQFSVNAKIHIVLDQREFTKITIQKEITLPIKGH